MGVLIGTLWAVSASGQSVASPEVLAVLPEPVSEADFIAVRPSDVEIGRLLFYDRILSGNRNISCAACHHSSFGSGDGLSLGIGEGGIGLGPQRRPGTGNDAIKKRIPRNAQGLWNLGAQSLEHLFHDGRLSRSDLYGNGFNSPAEEWLPTGFNDLLSAQAVFPLVAQFEMAGNPNENQVAGAIHDRVDNAWPYLAKRVRSIDEYAQLFIAADPDIHAAEDIDIVDIGNALGAFVNWQWRSIDSPFDEYLRGDSSALTAVQTRGLRLFYGKAQCVACHSGSWLSDGGFHALSLPAFGPGRAGRFNDIARDLGRLKESDRLEDAYRFRTPMLRNVALTAPYGHNGAYPTLEGIIRHHLDPEKARAAWKPSDAQLIPIPALQANDFVILSDRLEMARQALAIDITPVPLSDAEVDSLVAFMHALTGADTDAAARNQPSAVPSGLPLDMP